MNFYQGQFLLADLKSALASLRLRARTSCEELSRLAWTADVDEDAYYDRRETLLESTLEATTFPAPEGLRINFYEMFQQLDELGAELLGRAPGAEVSCDLVVQLARLASAMGRPVPRYEDGSFLCRFSGVPVPAHLTARHAPSLSVSVIVPNLFSEKLVLEPLEIVNLTIEDSAAGSSDHAGPVACGTVRISARMTGGRNPLAQVIEALPLRMSHATSGPQRIKFDSVEARR